MNNLSSNTGGPFRSFRGYVVADSIEDNPVVITKAQDIKKDGMFAVDWKTLVNSAFRQYEEYFDAVAERAPDDERIRALAEFRGEE